VVGRASQHTLFPPVLLAVAVAEKKVFTQRRLNMGGRKSETPSAIS